MKKEKRRRRGEELERKLKDKLFQGIEEPY